MSPKNSVMFRQLDHHENSRNSGLWLIIPIAFLFTLLMGCQSFAQSEKIKLVVLGDSLSAGYGLGPGEGFPEQLQVLVDQANLPIIIENAGVSGDTTSGGLARLNWSVSKDVDVVLIELGANDALRGLSPDVSRKNLEEMIKQLQARNINVLLAGMLAPPNMGKDYETEFNAIFPELAKQYDVPLYPFFLDGVAADPALNQADGIHPTLKGIKIIANRFFPFLQNSLAEQ